MRPLSVPLLLLVALSSLGCGEAWPPPGAKLADERANFKTTLVRQEQAGYPVEQPPPGVFQIVQYPSPEV